MNTSQSIAVCISFTDCCPTPGMSDSVGLEWDPRVYAFNKFPGDALLLIQRPYLENHESRRSHCISKTGGMRVRNPC